MPTACQLSNEAIDLIVATGFGPRVLRCGFLGGPNLFGEWPDLVTATGLGDWTPRGGHRLWAAPEEMPGSYAPDNGPIEWEQLDDQSVVLRQKPDAAGMAKTITIRLPADEPKATVQHELFNAGHWPIECAAWALTIMAPGGVAVLPQPDFRSHAEQLRPVRAMALWPFTNLSDPRWFLGKELITMTPDAARAEPQKIGIRNERGWCACIWPHAAFVKQVRCDPTARYPDFGVNNEVYSAGSFLELETLGTLDRLEPGQHTTHLEHWSLFGLPGHGLPGDEAQLHSMLERMVRSSGPSSSTTM